MNERIISIVKGDDGLVQVLVDRARQGQKRTRVYHNLTPASQSRWQRVAWRCKKVTPFFTLNYVGFTLYLPRRGHNDPQ